MKKPVRYLTQFLQDDLKEKMVFLSGPRQSGKTTLAKSLVSPTSYFNYDIAEDRKKLRLQLIDENPPVIALDEVHKMPKWKNYLKGLYDDRRPNQTYLVTGSAKLDTFQRQGDALTGRYYSYSLHPICPSEAHRWDPQKEPHALVDFIMNHGGFPEAFFNPRNSRRLRDGRFQTVIQEDLNDLSRVLSLRQFETLIEILRERGCGQISYTGLAEDLSVSVPTIKKWLQWLERLYVVFMVYPWSTATARSLKREPKFYFYDCAANEEPGLRFENLVGGALLKHCDFIRSTTGRKLELRYFKDKEQREVDFVVIENKRALFFVETKLSDEMLSHSLSFLKEKYPSTEAVQLVKTTTPSKTIRRCKIISAGDWMIEHLLKID